MADIHIVYGAAQCNSRASAHMYRERYPNRRVSHHSTFTAIDRRLHEQGTFTRSLYTVKPSIPVPIPYKLQVYRSNASCPKSVQTPHFEEEILRRFHALPLYQHPSSGTCNSHWTHECVKKSAQSDHLNVEDYPQCLQFMQWYLQPCTVKPHFLSVMLFINEAQFTRECVLKSCNSHVWAEDIIHIPFIRNYQEQFGIN
ncbi:hypothetical protein PR048_005440, partial [Dryococelus australis]